MGNNPLLLTIFLPSQTLPPSQLCFHSQRLLSDGKAARQKGNFEQKKQPEEKGLSISILLSLHSLSSFLLKTKPIGRLYKTHLLYNGQFGFFSQVNIYSIEGLMW